METMRHEVAQLEAAKRELERRFPYLGIENRPPAPQILTEKSVDPSKPREIQTKYLQVLQEIDRLRQANRAMTLDVLERDLFRSAAQNLLDARAKDVSTAPLEYDDQLLIPLPAPTSAPPPMPMRDAAEFAQRVTRQIRTSRLESDLTMTRFTGARVFGWTDFRMRTDATIHFTIKKTFPNQSATTLAQRSWDILSDAAQLRQLLPSGIQCELRPVQRVGDDACIFNRVTTDRGFSRLQYTALRTTYMLVRSMDDNGNYTVGMKTIDLPAFRAALADHESWCDIYYWFHFQDVAVDGADETATSVVFGGALSYFTETIARLWLAELVFLAIRWETKVVSPVLLKN